MILFTIGTLGVVWRRNAITVFMCIELMLNAANLAFVTFAYSINESMAASVGAKPLDGAIIALFVMTVAAAEAGVGLAIFLRVYRQRNTIYIDEFIFTEGLMNFLPEFIMGALDAFLYCWRFCGCAVLLLDVFISRKTSHVLLPSLCIITCLCAWAWMMMNSSYTEVFKEGANGTIVLFDKYPAFVINNFSRSCIGILMFGSGLLLLLSPRMTEKKTIAAGRVLFAVYACDSRAGDDGGGC